MNPSGLYCLGNALVDYEFKITDEYLAEHSIEKGVMTLADAEEFWRHYDALHALAQVGNKEGGGSAANSLVAYARFGGTGSFCCILGFDESGRFFEDELNTLGIVRTGSAQTQEDAPTGHCLVLITPDAERTMITHLGCNIFLQSPADRVSLMRDRKCFYSESYLVSSDAPYASLLEHLESARALDCQVALSLSDVSMVRFFAPRVKELLAGDTDILFGNMEELGVYTGETNPDKMAAALDGRVAHLALTHGSAGAFLYSNGEKKHIPAKQVNAVDTVGAGDMFAAGLLFARLEKECDFESAAQFATLAAAKVVSRFGPRLSGIECDELIQDFFR